MPADALHTQVQAQAADRTEGPKGRRPRGGRRGGGAESRDVTTAKSPPSESPSHLSMTVLLLAAVLVVLAAVVVAVAQPWAPPQPRAVEPPAPPALDLNQLLRTNSEVLSSALKETTSRADHAVGEREKATAELQQCRRDVKQRDDYLKDVAAPELQRLRQQLREAQDALVRIESYFGAAAVAEAQRHRGWLQRALAVGADLYGSQEERRVLVGAAGQR